MTVLPGGAAWRTGVQAPDGATGLELRVEDVHTLLCRKPRWHGRPGWGTAHIDVGFSCLNSHSIRLTSLTEPTLVWACVEPLALRQSLHWRENQPQYHRDCITLEWPGVEHVPPARERVSGVRLVRWGAPSMCGMHHYDTRQFHRGAYWHMLWPDEVRDQLDVWLDALEEQGAIES